MVLLGPYVRRSETVGRGQGAPPCKYDTSPNYPSCGTIESQQVAIKVPDPWFAIAPCPHDPTLTPEQCYSHTR